MLKHRKRKTVDEEVVIKTIWHVLAKNHSFRRRDYKDPFNDDVSWVRLGRRKKLLVAKCDMLVSSTDVPRQMTPMQIGMKAITSSVSDFASKGVTPQFCLVSIALPREKANRKYVSDLARGFRKASQVYGLRVLAGDTNAAISDTIIDCATFGYADRLVLRRGARAGDLVGVTGRFGLQPCGLEILEGKVVTRDPTFKRDAINSVLNPRARLDFGLSASKYLTSAIDSSDGLAISLYHLAEASNVAIEIDDVPLARGVAEFSKDFGRSASELGLFGGEEYEIVCTYPNSKSRILEKMGMITIGEVRELREQHPVVKFNGRKVGRKGWMHFGA